MLGENINFLCWNVRGLNCVNRRSTVHETIAATTCHVACLQETKLDHMDQFIASYLGGNRLRSFAHRPATGTRGGILMLWDDNAVQISDVVSTVHCLSAMVLIRATGNMFKITTVYGPTEPSCKDAFFAELLAPKASARDQMAHVGRFQSNLSR